MGERANSEKNNDSINLLNEKSILSDQKHDRSNIMKNDDTFEKELDDENDF